MDKHTLAQHGNEIRRNYKVGGERVIDALDFARSERKMAAQLSLDTAKIHFDRLVEVTQSIIDSIPESNPIPK